MLLAITDVVGCDNRLLHYVTCVSSIISTQSFHAQHAKHDIEAWWSRIYWCRHEPAALRQKVAMYLFSYKDCHGTTPSMQRHFHGRSPHIPYVYVHCWTRLCKIDGESTSVCAVGCGEESFLVMEEVATLRCAGLNVSGVLGCSISTSSVRCCGCVGCGWDGTNRTKDIYAGAPRGNWSFAVRSLHLNLGLQWDACQFLERPLAKWAGAELGELLSGDDVLWVLFFILTSL